jgi:chemotaxis protein CheD
MSNIKPYDYILKPGYIFVPDEPIVLGAIVGNGIIVTIYDIRRKKGGMCHFIQPRPGLREKKTAIFGEVAVPTLLKLFLDHGSRPMDLKAHIIGGAQNHQMENHRFVFKKNSGIGNENFNLAQKILEKYQITNVALSMGGYQGKKILYNTFTNELFSATTDKIRLSDWK